MNVKKGRDRPDDFGELRRRAEAALRGRESDAGTFSAQQVRRLIHELEVHQIELEMQNEELRRTQEELEVARDKYTDLYDFAPIGYLTVSENGLILEANLAAASLLGTERGVLQGQSLSRFIATDEQGLYYKHHRAVVAANHQQTCEITMVTWDGTPVDARIQSVGIANNDVTVTKWRTVISDVTERKRAEQTLRVRDRAIAAAANGIILTDWTQPDNPIIYCNPAFEKITGYTLDEVLGRNARFLQGDDREQEGLKEVRAAIEQGYERHVVVRNYRKDGTLFWNELTISPVRDKKGQITHFIGIQNDITKRKEKEAQLLQAKKMEIVGQLTGGIAHDFNNLLTVILGNLGLLAKRIGEAGDPDIREFLADALSAARDGADLTHRLLALSRKQLLEPKQIDINTILDDLARFLRRLLRESIKLSIKGYEEAAMVCVDPGQLESTLLNLVINARDAMPQGGTLALDVARQHIEADEATSMGLTPGAYVVTSITDSGIGMSPEVLSHVVEPFFTTKQTKKGTGLGLSMAYNFTQQSGGDLRIESTLGKGTTVSLMLPESGPAKGIKVSKEVEKGLPGGSETILIVEDEPRVRKLVKRRLQELGYQIVEAENAMAAKEILAAGTAVSLLFSDIIMPGRMNGIELAHWAISNKPTLKVLFTTGAIHLANVEEERVNTGNFPLLRKPYTYKTLAQTIRALLDE